MMENIRESNHDRPNLEGNNIRQLVSRIEELSNAISQRPNQVETVSEERHTFTGSNSSTRASRERSAAVDRLASTSSDSFNERTANRYGQYSVGQHFPGQRPPPSACRGKQKRNAGDNKPFM